MPPLMETSGEVTVAGLLLGLGVMFAVLLSLPFLKAIFESFRSRNR